MPLLRFVMPLADLLDVLIGVGVRRASCAESSVQACAKPGVVK